MRTIHEAAKAIRAGTITPVTLVEECLAAIDRWEPHVKAWVFVDREGSFKEAERLTAELKRGLDRGPLHGIPLGIKDIIDVFDWPTAAGSKLWTDSIARQDAPVVTNLREAGAIFLGKTVTTQYASFDPPVTRNPWNLSRTPGGSSSGSAVAVATGMCFGALGSQTGGSLTRPASYCGVLAFKPSYGLVSTRGVVPLAPSLDHLGPMALCVEDLAILLGVMVEAKNFTCRERFTPDYLRECAPRYGTGVSRVRGFFEQKAEPSVRAAMDAIEERIIADDGLLPGVSLPAGFAEIEFRHRTVMAVEAAAYHRTRLERHPDDYAPNIRRLLEEGLATTAVELADTKRHQKKLGKKMRRLLESSDILLTPATTSPAPDAATTGDPAFNSPWSYLGLPTVSLPTGHFVEGLPLAVQLVGGRFREAELFRTAAWLERLLAVGPLTPPLPA